MAEKEAWDDFYASGGWNPEAQQAQRHVWGKYVASRDWHSCKNCGVLMNSRNFDGLCKGRVSVKPREDTDNG